MNIHEYQAKALFAQYGIPVSHGALANTLEEANEVIDKLEKEAAMLVVKAQIHAGGRGKGGGVKVCRTAEAAKEAAKNILGMQLITHQTGPEGQKVHKIWIEQGKEIERELYLAIVLDRGAQCLTVMASPDGGMDIEEVAEKTPERIFTTRLNGSHQVWPYQARSLLFACGLNPKQVGQGVGIIQNLVKLAVENDAVLIEINPLAITPEGDLVAVDGKMDFDESSLKRNPHIAALADPEECDPLERKAQELGVNYVRLSGYVGTMVNGAGLAMATMDAIKQAGAEAANFLDAGGGANEEMVASGFEVMLSDPNVRGILINIFGGILRCDIVAQGVVNAAKRVNMTLPLVIRLEGTNVEEGRRILNESGLKFETATSMAEAAQKIAAITGAAS